MMVGLPTEALIAQVMVAKFGDHLPFYRQAEIYARQGITLDRATLGNWVGRACFHLRPIADHLRERLKSSDRVFMDETRAPVLDPGRRKTKTGYFWAIVSDDRGHGGADPPIVMFHYAPGRGAVHALRFLEGFRPWLEAQLSRIPKSSKLAEDIRYTLAHWPGLTRFLEDGCLELDTNPVENQIRKIALTRKNALFAGHEVGAENWALLASLIANCKMGDVDPVRYLTNTLQALLDGHPKSRIDELMTWNFEVASTQAA